MAWRAAALAGALLWGACSKEPAPAQAPAPKPARAEASEDSATPESEAPETAENTESEPEVEDKGPPPEFKLGQSRSEVMNLFGNCAERREFIPAGPNSLYVEIYQAKDTEACRKRLGERHFTIRGGELYRITDGLIPPPAEYREPPPGT